MATKPSGHIGWGVGNPDPANRIVEPSSAKKQTGWNDDEQPPAPFFNWLFFRIHEWLTYFEERTDTFAARYDVIIGDTATDQSATHDTLAEAIADAAVPTDAWVLVKESQTIDTTISMTKARWRIDCKPGVVFTKGAVTTGISMEAEGIEWNGGRFVGFTTAGDKAIAMTVAGEYCKVIGTRFAASTDTEVDDALVPAGKSPVIAQTITEV